ncbi:Sec-independent protein translocase protein TatB [Herminiimonas sp. CN]|uniref:Sec-independent protein translocase protein TatB n=1 Tax=Herminiimonas sp. CN TaxID=1349818 RepID=UPI0004731CB2|nr:Sec-independent protein translocase protein TatB [Herminiimonas sp. CN]
MIDLGLSKLALIGVVALVVIGPEKLPKVARMAGSLLGRAQRYINDVKSEVSREMELDELRQMQQEVQEAAKDVESSIARNLSDTERELSAAVGDGIDNSATQYPPFSVPMEQVSAKAKSFRKKKLARTSAIPGWYKQRHGGKSHLLSGAARVSRYRPGNKTLRSFH